MTVNGERVVKHATAAKGLACDVRQQENNAPFPKPWGPQTGGSPGGKAKHGQPFYHGLLSLPATLLSLTFMIWEGRAKEIGGVAVVCVGEGGGGGEDRYSIPPRAQSVQSDWSLSCLPVEASWTKHRPIYSLRTLLL